MPVEAGPSVEISELTFTSGGVTCRAWLYRPVGAATPGPIVVFAHGFSGTNALHYGRRARAYAERGLTVLDFDPRHLGASEGTPRQIVDARRQADDLRAAFDFATTLPEADPSRVALFGSSLGGGLAIDVASSRPAVAALVVTVPHVDGLTNLPGGPVAARLRIVAAALRDRLGRLSGKPPVTVRVFGSPSSKALIDRDGADDLLPWVVEPSSTWDTAYTVLTAEQSSYRNEAAAWETFLSVFYRPGSKLKNVTCPTLILSGDRDTVTPPKPQRRAAAQCASATLQQMPWNHFDPFHRKMDEAVDAEVSFFLTHLAAD
ncbi:MAG: alpha/beta fold hydrolase [Mycobacteriales bacterium]